MRLAAGLFLAGMTLLTSGLANAGDLPRRAHVGVGIAPPDKGEKGAVISLVAPDSPSEASGILAGDRIIRVGNRDINSPADLLDVVKKSTAGGDVPVRLVRDGKEMDLTWGMKALPIENHEGLETLYDDVQVGDHRQRTFITKPIGAGPFPAIFFLQGLTCTSVESPIDKDHPYWQFADALSREGFVVMRIEKSGTGDSEGPPCQTIDFDTEAASYQAAFEKLVSYDFVKTDEVFLFGHSMGGVFAPLVAAANDVRGVISYGTLGRGWMEYTIEMQRFQSALQGNDLADVEQAVRNEILLQTELCIDKKTGPEILAAHPELQEHLQNVTRDGNTFWTRHYTFFHQLGSISIAEAWQSIDDPTLFLWGESDFVSFRDEHELLARIRNSADEGSSTFMTIPGAEHSFMAAATMQDAMQDNVTAPYNPAITKAIVEWTRGLMAKS